MPPLRVLVIEDNPADAELVRRMLSKAAGLAFEVEHADRFSAGRDRLAKGDVHVVLLDLKLPDGQGLELVDQLRDQAPAVPIVVLTGTYEEESLGLQALQKGAQDYLFKDRLDDQGLARAIRYAIERKRVEEELRLLNFELKQRVENITWLNRIMMEREALILKLKEQVKSLQAQVPTKTPPRP